MKSVILLEKWAINLKLLVELFIIAILITSDQFYLHETKSTVHEHYVHEHYPLLYLHRQKFGTIRMLLVGSPVKFGIALLNAKYWQVLTVEKIYSKC